MASKTTTPERFAAIRYGGYVYAAGLDSDHTEVARAMRAALQIPATAQINTAETRGYVVGGVFVPA